MQTWNCTQAITVDFFGSTLPLNSPLNFIHRRGQQDGTPLHRAAMGGHANVCALLLDRGTSLEAHDKHVLMLAFVTSILILPVVLQRHMSSRAAIFGHRSELFVSCDFGHGQLRATNAVLRHALTTPWLSRSAHQDQSPLHYAANHGHESVCALLLDRGASLEARNKDVFI